jgi:hypothetical protein
LRQCADWGYWQPTGESAGARNETKAGRRGRRKRYFLSTFVQGYVCPYPIPEGVFDVPDGDEIVEMLRERKLRKSAQQARTA